MKKPISILFKTGIAVIWITTMSLSGCGGGASTPPSATPACAITGNISYNCTTGPDNPASLVFFGEGGMIVDISGNSSNRPQFMQNIQYYPINYSSPNVSLQNSTMSTGTQTISPPNVYFDVPTSDSYVIKAYYIEYGFSAPPNGTTGNIAFCTNPIAPNGMTACFRWYKKIDVTAGYTPNCSSFSIAINEQDPGGFLGKCN